MKTIFCLFRNYEDAEAAVAELLERDFDQDEMNVVVDAELAKPYLDDADVNLQRANVDVTEEIGERRIHGLNQLLAGQEPALLPDVGEVFAPGAVATTLVKTSGPEGGLREALVDFDIPEEAATTYTRGVVNNGLLFFTRTDDERAPEATSVLREQEGETIYAVP